MEHIFLLVVGAAQVLIAQKPFVFLMACRQHFKKPNHLCGPLPWKYLFETEDLSTLCFPLGQSWVMMWIPVLKLASLLAQSCRLDLQAKQRCVCNAKPLGTRFHVSAPFAAAGGEICDWLGRKENLTLPTPKMTISQAFITTLIHSVEGSKGSFFNTRWPFEVPFCLLTCGNVIC